MRGYRSEEVAPCVLHSESTVPELLGRGIAGHFAFSPGLHIDLVDALAVRGIGKPHAHLLGVVLRLADPFGNRVLIGLGLNDRQLVIAVDENVISLHEAALLAVPLNAPWGDHELTENFAATYLIPAGGLQGGVDEIRTRISFVHKAAVASLTKDLLSIEFSNAESA